MDMSNQQRKGQRKAQGQQRKGQRQRIQQLERKKQRHGYVNNKGQSKGNIGQASPLKGKSGKGFKRKRKTSTGEGKGNTQTCYRCEGMQSNSVQHQREQHGRTTDGCNRPMRLTGRSRQLMSWWTSDQTLDMSMATTDAIYIYIYIAERLALPPAQQGEQPPTRHIGAVKIAHATTRQATEQAAKAHQDNRAFLMVDSGAATHVCPTWFATEFTMSHNARRASAWRRPKADNSNRQ